MTMSKSEIGAAVHKELLEAFGSLGAAIALVAMAKRDIVADTPTAAHSKLEKLSDELAVIERRMSRANRAGSGLDPDEAEVRVGAASN